MQAKKTKRAYDSSGRRASAEERRRRILQTARQLFSQYGYGATSIERIGGEAGVAVPTVYSLYRSKRALLFALLDQADAQADVAGLLNELQAAEENPRKQLRQLVSFTCRFYALVGDIIDIARGAGSTDEDLLALWQEGEERRLRGERPLVDAWHRAGALRRDLSAKEASDILWAMTGTDHYRLFIVERKWSAARYGAWLEGTLAWLLLQ